MEHQLNLIKIKQEFEQLEDVCTLRQSAYWVARWNDCTPADVMEIMTGMVPVEPEFKLLDDRDLYHG